MSLVNSLLPLDCPIYISPDLYQLLTSKVRISNVVGEPLVDISRSQMSASTRNLKRVSDVVLSFITLLLISPLLLVIAILVKCDSRGPVFYRQERIGYHKKPFYIYKFRSMKVDAEAGGPALSTLNDERIARLGRVLRKYRLDELPNFWNVLRGDMSIVGPRPEREYYIKQILAKAPYYTLIHQVRPGITSWGMVKYGYASDVDGMIERLKYDLLYIENVSMLVDLKILFYTVQIVVTGKGI
jgi:exopolysaccharide biosynthesis polyprenyl glycosylphosphotransferase